MSTAEHFPTEINGLPEARRPEVLELADGDEFDLRIAPVAKQLGKTKVRMLAYNGSIPWPILKVKEGSEIVVNVANQGDMEATVHWHGLRLDNRYDGTHETQEPIPVGGSFTARCTFPDPGVYWYHPHIREDYGQEMGLYGNILVEPAAPEYWPPVNRELALTLDDILLEDGRVAPFSRAETTHTAMGRFGDVLLVGGETDLSLPAQLGDDDMVAERERIAEYLEAEPDKTLAFIAEMDMGTPEGDVIYACPMHPKVIQDAPGHCPECGMKLLPAQLVAEAADGHEHGPEHEGHDDAEAGGIEWEDDMVEVNRLTTPANMRWKLIDRDADAENAAIDWRFRVGDQVKIRLLNEMAGDHPMHHPFHVHGAGRFLVLSRDGVVEESLVWKDTVLVRTGETVDILLDVSNPGLWMAHCHIAEHHESGMMLSFEVTE